MVRLNLSKKTRIIPDFLAQNFGSRNSLIWSIDANKQSINGSIMVNRCNRQLMYWAACGPAAAFVGRQHLQ